ncbi:MAG: hypothetical protein ABFS30_15905 [Pseudomonadota bacterium]
MSALLAGLETKPGSIDHIILPAPARVAKRLCKILGLEDSGLADDLAARCGHTGTAHPLLLLAATLEQAELCSRVRGAMVQSVSKNKKDVSYRMLYRTTEDSEWREVYKTNLGEEPVEFAGFAGDNKTIYLRSASGRASNACLSANVVQPVGFSSIGPRHAGTRASASVRGGAPKTRRHRDGPCG